MAGSALTSPRRRILTTSPLLLVVGAGVLLTALVSLLLTPSLSHAAVTQDGTLYLWLAATAIVAGGWYVVMRRTVVREFPARWAALPTIVVVIVDTLLSRSGSHPTGPAAHQVGWGLLGLLFGYAAVMRWRVPGWLIAYAGLGVALQLAAAFRLTVIPDIGLSAVALLVMWLVAVAVQREGGAMQVARWIAIGYWAVTALAILVHFSHVPVGALTPDTIVMPWQGGLHNIISTGNEIGYGFISGQPGREVSFVVCAYYLIAWRYDRRRRDGWLAALAFVLFLTGYGRIAIVGAAIGFVLILVTDRRGTRASGVAAASVLAVLALSLGGIESQFLNISGRTGSNASTVAGATSGHLSLWSQQLNLFLERPLTGVGSNPTIEQDVEARFSPFFTDPIPPTVERLDSDGSRGEGGWTGLVAQRGVVTGGALLALIALAISYCLSAFPASTEGKQDMTLLRAVIVASLIFYITDEVPFGIYTVSGYVLGQITMIAVVRAIVTHQGRGGDLAPRSAPAD